MIQIVNFYKNCITKGVAFVDNYATIILVREPIRQHSLINSWKNSLILTFILQWHLYSKTRILSDPVSKNVPFLVGTRKIALMLPYQAVAMDYAVSSGFQRQTPIGLGVNINPAFTHSWFVPADLCVTYKQTPLLEPGHVILLYYITLPLKTTLVSTILN